MEFSWHISLACVSLLHLHILVVEATGRLPSFHASGATSIVADQLAAAGAKWWTRVGDHIYHTPHETSKLSRDINDYYYAMGSHSALTDELRLHRVGGEGRWHIFHLPNGGPSMLQTVSHAADRRSSISTFTHLRHGTSLPDVFPEYKGKDTYVNPLTDFGRALEKEAVSEITEDSYMEYLKKVTSLTTRSFRNDDGSKQAVDLLEKEFSAMGFTVCKQEFHRSSHSFTNVIAYVPGENPGSIVAGAHYDSRPYDGSAPGAEDNGSGVAGLLAIAHAFKMAKLKPLKSVYFVAFGGEEIGLMGSGEFAYALSGGDAVPIPEECRAHGEDNAEVAAIIMDEIGWMSPAMDRTVNLETYDWCLDLMEHLAHSCHDHNGDDLKIVHNAAPFGSDHMSFLNRHLSSVLTINGDDEAYPNYHMSSDTIDNVNGEYASQIAKMNMGALVRIAGIAGAEEPTAVSFAAKAQEHRLQKRRIPKPILSSSARGPSRGIAGADEPLAIAFAAMAEEHRLRRRRLLHQSTNGVATA